MSLITFSSPGSEARIQELERRAAARKPLNCAQDRIEPPKSPPPKKEPRVLKIAERK